MSPHPRCAPGLDPHNLPMMSSLLALLPTRASVLLPILSLGVVHLVACSSSGEGAGGSGGSASTSTSTSMSTSTSTSTGQGGDGGAVPEARVIVRDHAGRPGAGIDVLVHDATGATTQQTKTDKNGAAVVDLAQGGGVTALYHSSQDTGASAYQAVTVVGLDRGAEVRLVADVESQAAPPAPMTLSFTGTAPLQSTDWDILLSCYEEGNTAEKTLSYAGCRTSDTYDVVALLYPWNKHIAFPAQPVEPGKSVAFQLDPAKAEESPLVAVDMSGLPAGTSLLEARLWANRPEGGRSSYLTSKSIKVVQDTTLSLPRLIVSPKGSFDLELGAETAVGGIHARMPYAEKALPMSPVAWKIPVMTRVEKIGPIIGEARRPEVPWALELGGMPTDAIRIQLSYQASNPAPDTANHHAARWTLYVASNPLGVVKFPDIPASFEGYAPEDTTLTVTAEHIDVEGTASVIAAVNADFDRTGSTWTSNVFSSPMLP